MMGMVEKLQNIQKYENENKGKNSPFGCPPTHFYNVRNYYSFVMFVFCFQKLKLNKFWRAQCPNLRTTLYSTQNGFVLRHKASTKKLGEGERDPS